MNLPKIDLPTYDVHLKSLNKTIKYRPFLVKEEKLLLIALESNDFTTIVDAVKQVIHNCLLDDSIDVNDLPMFELEYLFLHLRARSIGEKIAMSFICQNVVNDKKCNSEMETEIDLLQVSLNNKDVNSTIMITDDVGIKLKYPSINATKLLQDDKADNALVKLIEHCTEYLFDKDQTYNISDMQENELSNFLENLTKEQFDKIRYFFENIPNIKYEGDLVCSKCNKVHRIHLEGMLDFFE